MEKHELLAKGNDLVEKINAAMSNIEVIDIAKNNVALASAELCVNIHHDGSEVMDIYEFRKVLSEKSIEKIKAFVMTELDMAQEESMKFLEQIGIVVNTDEGESYIDDGNVNPDDYIIDDEIPAPDPEPKVEIEPPKKEITEKELMELSAAGKTCEEIAAITGIPRSTVWYKLDKLKKEGASSKRKKK